MKTTKQILTEARELVSKGWVQGEYERDGCYCLVGAINEVRGDSHGYAEAIGTMFKLIGNSLSDWNDMPERTQAEVVAAFDKAIAAVSR